MPLSVDILTIFPGMFAGVLTESILGRSIDAGLLDVRLTDIRAFAKDRHRAVDDRPYGGGPGMVFKPEPTIAAVEAVLESLERRRTGEAPASSPGKGPERRQLILTPQGRRLEQRDLRELASADSLVLLCGHYEGFDERILEILCASRGFEEVSIGDYVLSGGEIPAMVILDGVARLLPGALGHPDSAQEESFEAGTLEHPHYTRPPEFRGLRVPEVLLSGDHAAVRRWRASQALQRTRERRRDLLDAAWRGSGGESRASGSGRSCREGQGALAASGEGRIEPHQEGRNP